MTELVSSAGCEPGGSDPVPPSNAPILGGPVEVWTDGSCRPNPGVGAWAFVMRNHDGREFEKAGAERDTTNNRMELMAAIRALEVLPRPFAVVLHTDSEYVFLGMTARLERWQRDGWRTAKRKPVDNSDLWQRLVAAAARHQVDWRWTRGHADDPMNLRVDALAAAAREKAGRGHV